MLGSCGRSGGKGKLAISMWTRKYFLAPSALVSVLVYELLFIFGDTLLDKVPPGSSVLRNMFPGLYSPLLRDTLRVSLYRFLGLPPDRSRGRPRKWYKDNLIVYLKRCEINPESWEHVAQDRATRRNFFNQGVI